MAEQENILTRLGKLFQNQIVVRKTPSGQLKVKDVDFTQTGLTSNFIDRFSRIMTRDTSFGSKYAARENAKNAFDVQRKELFRDYELMDQDPIISSALDIYSDESTVDNVESEIMKIQTDNPKVHKILHSLFYGILNIQFNLWPWIRNMTKYGDHFLYLEIIDKLGVVNVKPLSAYEVYRLEDHDLEQPKLVQFEIREETTTTLGRSVNNQNELFENYEIAHFRLMSDANFLPYGKSSLEGARKVWKQLQLMEDAMLIHRIMRAPEKRIFKMDVGNIPPNEVENFMQQIINKMKKIPVIDQATGEYNLRYNIESTTEDYFLPVRGGDSGTEIETLQGLSNEGAIDDIEYLRNKMMAALKIPKAFLGYEEGVGCVVPETEIPLLNGEIKTVKEIIEDYENGIKHYTYAIDPETNMIVPGEIEWAGYTKQSADLVRVNLDNDKYIDCTPDHRFLTRDGKWIEAQDLQENQSLMPLYLDETTQKNKQGYTTVYHPGTEKYQEVHRLVAEHYDMVEVGSGKVVHHVDFNKKNNNPDNFDCSMNYIEHRQYHSKLTEKTINSPENITKRLNDPKWIKSMKAAGRKGGLKSADKLVKWLKENGPWNKGRVVDLECKNCGDVFTVQLHRKYKATYCSMDCMSKSYSKNMVGNTYNTKYAKITYEELLESAKESNSFKDLENRLGIDDRPTLNRVFGLYNIDKVDFIFRNMPLALQNKNFMQNYRKYEEQYLNHKVVSVEFLTETKDTCDLTITKYHNFATNAGVIIHNSKATLAAEDVRFARTIERLQKILVAELEKIAIVHLYTQGFEDAELINFTLELTNPSMIHEQEKLELLTQQIEVASSIMENKLFSREWIYDNIFELNDHEKKETFDQIIEDLKQQFRFEQIAMEGNDPAVTGEKDNTSAEAGGGDSMFGESDWGGSEKDRFKKDINPHGAKSKDLSAATAYHRERQGSREFKGGSPLATSKGSTLVAREGLLNQLKQKFERDVSDKSILSEENILNDENDE